MPASPAATAIAAPAGEAATGATSATPVPELAWRVHSAKASLAEQALAIWPWLAGLAFLLGAALMFLFQQNVMRRRLAAMAFEAADRAPVAEPAYAPAMEPLSEIEPEPLPAPVSAYAASHGAAEAVETPPAPSEPADLDLVTWLAEPEDSSQAATLTGPAPSPASPPALDVLVNPLEVTLAARRMSATLLNTALNYELVVSNNGSEPIGPVQVGGDMIGAHASLPTRSQLELPGQDIAPLHRLAALQPGESVTLTGEFRLPLAAITPIRNGSAALFVPLARFRVEAMRKDAPPLVINRTFVIGESQDRPGAALKPFRLDLGPRLYSRIGQREVAQSA